ncbi:MAG: undecaprenyldiphospho-muramoylpentapeptide beta-N-acetylglucosaminyltransferase [Oscillospiraceae bacterium]|jgi:UDP-N-acetylglucosamine--N-acetylmuramyl-(pentapeptide) pyrophosphoryl-undecaprenol N-acetylglucosamine transferase|nr:undecaprenyldiphospho-muramoylpentapeptide beta-N-acetylglucosaminyltransferase [Oscillospiraceae bacterium]
MRVILVGGGTAGHINPALAVALYIKNKEPRSKVLYVGAKGGMEETLVPKENLDFRGITVSGFSRKLNFESFKKNLITIKNIFTASHESKKILEEFNPDICIGTGGYVSGPLLREACKKNIPFIIHEQNAYPGITTKILSKKASAVMLAAKAAKKHLNKNLNIVVTGNPLRNGIGKIDTKQAKKELNLDNGKPLVLSFGGSLGARTINESVAELILWSQKNNLYNHVHAYGKYGKWLPKLLEEKGIKKSLNIDVREYIDNMPICMAAADIVICRSGAITLSELKACGKPSILIPSPNVAENHQYYNAMEFVEARAAALLEEKELSGENLIKKLSESMNNIAVLKEGINKLQKELDFSPSEKIYNVIKSILK